MRIFQFSLEKPVNYFFINLSQESETFPDMDQTYRELNLKSLELKY